ncbi:MAG: hypothetical protein HC850_10705 [Rhodomicrobium sp.]|nr:hypothetical protein [Rhodomicrobium sp.]
MIGNREKAFTGIVIILFVAALNVPYSMLMALFEYDDILRRRRPRCWRSSTARASR